MNNDCAFEAKYLLNEARANERIVNFLIDPLYRKFKCEFKTVWLNDLPKPAFHMYCSVLNHGKF